jgi:dTDP-4-dehydrorhamnose reductase
MREDVQHDRPILVLGARGMLGTELVGRLPRSASGSRADVIAWDIEELDICDADAVVDALTRLRPGLVVNSAAYTDVDGCESNVETAMAVNAHAPGHLAAGCGKIGARLVHFSTDFVFDGLSDLPYRPDDAANPLSVYGRSKWEGERAIHEARCTHLIVRTSWLFGLHGRNFVEAILARAEANEPLRVVNDQFGRPTAADDLADAVVRLLDAGAEHTIHFANGGRCSRFEFAREIVRRSGSRSTVEPISSQELHRPARRPAFSVLDTSRYTEITGAEPDSWQNALGRYLERRAGRREANAVT